MKNPRSLRSRAAFTLIELLVVISIIALLAGLAFTAGKNAILNARRVQAKTDMAQIGNAIQFYYTEYGRYPSGQAAPLADDRSATFGIGKDNSMIINVLRSPTNWHDDNNENPRQIKFLQPKVLTTTPTRAAVYDKNGDGKINGNWYDPWGTQYVIFIDADYAGDIDPSAAFTDITTKPSVSVGTASVGYYYVKHPPSRDIMDAARAFDPTTDLISWK